MTPIPTSYLSRDLYQQMWVEPDATGEQPAPPRDGERPWLGTGLSRLRRALDGAGAVWGRPVQAGRA